MNRQQRRAARKNHKGDSARTIEQRFQQALHAHQAGQLDQAQRLYRRLLADAPNHADALNNLGLIAHQRKRWQEAVGFYEKAITAAPGLPNAYTNLAVALRKLDRLDEAEAAYRQSLALQPVQPELLWNLGNLYRDLGRLDEAAAAYRQATALRPDFFRAHNALLASKRVTDGDPDLAALETLRSTVDRYDDRQQAEFYFAAGKAYDDLGDYDRAFDNLRRANERVRRQMDYDDSEQQRVFAEITAIFTPDLLQRLGTGGDPDPSPIFIVGMPRSGSTLTEQILASHPEVHGAGELSFLSDLDEVMRSDKGLGAGYPLAVPKLSPPKRQRLGGEYLSRIAPLRGQARRVTDKMPGNFWLVGLIKLILPNATIIHTRRHPAATCLSCYQQIFTSGQHFAYDLRDLGRFYRGYHQLMEHWKRLYPDAIHDVTYEALVADPEPQVRALLAHCGLPWNDACLEPHRNRRPLRTASFRQARQPLYTASAERWRHYEKHLTPLLEELGELVDGYRA